MSDEFEAAGAAIEGGLLAKAVEDESGDAIEGPSGQCLNCNSQVAGNYCTNCGQPLHVHRSIGALWHDILHGVLHFEGKFWRTIPLLAWKPGDLTRRYVRGERARFISPMALFLFSIFLMFAVFSFLGSPFDSNDLTDGDFSDAVATQSQQAEDQIKLKTDLLDTVGPVGQTKLREQITELKRERNVLAMMTAEVKRERNALAMMTAEELPYPQVGLGENEFQIGALNEDGTINPNSNISTGSISWDKRLNNALKKANANPSLLLYKLKANGYKFAWLLIPISVPFVWLTMVGRRGYRFYDHAVFATYSIAFMSLLFIFCAVLAAIGVPDDLWAPLLIAYPPFHIYRQLRHAYKLGRLEAIVRSIVMYLFVIISIILFLIVLLTLGVLG
ncbi:hypothetical protein MNBD_ALPHA04-1955 [hydrothermal vent metagenome]|uniref:Gll1812 protein n=1 Tax=hydrothermal vent metagenome TaxID=652676 RepID=A0A3B0RGY8_9ZZZZ